MMAVGCFTGDNGHRTRSEPVPWPSLGSSQRARTPEWAAAVGRESQWTSTSTRRRTSSPRTVYRCCRAGRSKPRRRRPPRLASWAGPVVVKAQVKTGGRGKAGGVKLATSPEETQEKAAAILGMDIKGHTVHRVLITEASDIAEEYYFSFLLDRSNRTFLAMCSAEGGMEIEQLAVERPEALARIPVDAITGVDAAKAAEIVAAGKIPAAVADQAADVIVKLWDTFVARGRHAGRGEPAGPRPARQGGRARRQGDPGRQRRLPPPRARRPGRRAHREPARGQGQGEEPELRQARRRAGRDHRQRRRPGHVHPGRRGLRGGEARRGEAGELPRHRRRRVGEGDGRRPRRHPGRPGRQERLRQRVRRHHRVRRGGDRHRRGAEDPRRRPRPSRWSSASTATTCSRVGAILDEANHPLVTQVDTMDDAADKAAELAAAGA